MSRRRCLCSPSCQTVYLASLQLGPNANWKALMIRAPEASIAAVRGVFGSIGVETLRRLQSVRYITSRTVLSERMMAMQAVYFGGLTIVLAAIGIHGQMAYLVSLQRKEIGVRMALGVAGAAIGMAMAFPAVNVLRQLLVDTSPYDIVAFTGAPSRRASPLRYGRR